MTDADAPFIRAVCANPDDDLPRLVFADRLEETSGSVACPKCRGHGELVAWCEIAKENDREVCSACRGSGSVSDGRRERAEFIRVQIELAATPDPHGGIDVEAVARGTGKPRCRCRSCALRQRERKLLDAHAAAWLSPFPLGYGVVNAGAGQYGWAFSARQPRLGERYCPTVFRRGFVAEVICEAADLLAHAGEIFGAGPVTFVVLSCRQPLSLEEPTGPHPFGHSYVWARAHTGQGQDYDRPGTRHWLPAVLYDLLGDRVDNICTYYASAEAAFADLSRAAVDFGRHAADLPAWGPKGRGAPMELLSVERRDGTYTFTVAGRHDRNGQYRRNLTFAERGCGRLWSAAHAECVEATDSRTMFRAEPGDVTAGVGGSPAASFPPPTP